MKYRISLVSVSIVSFVFVALWGESALADRGKLEIESEPGDAKIFINGKHKGNTPSEPGMSFVIELKEGEYVVEAIKSSGGPSEAYGRKEIFLADDTLHGVSLKLKQRPSANFRADRKKKSPRPIEPEMVKVSGGAFQMGCVSGQNCSNDEKPVHSVTLNSFLIGKYEVTFDEWDACVAAGGCAHNPEDGKAERGRRAVNMVSWDDVQKYIGWLNKATGKQYRLPTEAEWEYAARAGSTSKYFFGNSESDLGKYAWYIKNANDVGNKYAHKVGMKKPNSLGINDMHGNVWEWTADWYDKNYYGSSSSSNPKGPSTGSDRVVRGGSWALSADNCRTANRNYNSPDGRYINLGFRLLRTK